tara:strand:- start:1178 stop:1375 length:198 start_codon:yes stop_codon:yes gene_type:complete
MREGAERERWDRLAISITSFVNTQVKNPVDWKNYHKFLVDEREDDRRVTKGNIHKFKKFFPEVKE